MDGTASDNVAGDLLTLFEMTPDLVCIAGKDGFFKNINPAVPHTLGYTREELFARPISHLIHPDDKERTAARRAKLLKGEALLNFQNRYVTKTGEVVWLEWTSVYLPGKEVVFAIAKNITARKKAEQEVEQQFNKFRQLAAHFKNNLEQDRKDIATELHEELAQMVSVVRLDVDWISTNIPGLNEQSKNRIEHALAAADLLVNTIQRISFSLSPAMLDDLGLNAALEWYCKEFSTLSNIQCSFEARYDEALLSKEIQLDFFRICQEAMTSMKQHAKAEKIKVAITEKDKKIILDISGDHTSAGPELKKWKPLTIHERASSINAKCSIVEGPGKSISIVVEC